jgi:hypothetical protein
MAIDAALIAAGFLLRDAKAQRCDFKVLCMAAVGLSVGCYAAFLVPNILDSFQILQVQQFFLGSAGGAFDAHSFTERLLGLIVGGTEYPPPQPGYAGIAFLPSMFRPDMPVTTMAASMKTLLLCLAALVSLYASEQFYFRPRLLAAFTIFATMLLSQFGIYGMLQVGKDSIFAVLFAVASITALHRNDDEGNESGLFMSAAILLGAVAVPFLLMFWAAYVAFSGGSFLRQAFRQASWCLYPLIISVIGVHAAFAVPGTHHAGLLTAVAICALFLAAAAYVVRRLAISSWTLPFQLVRVIPLIPAALIFGIYLLMPITANVINGYENGLPTGVSHPMPLDGRTSAWQYLFSMFPANTAPMTACVAVALAILPIVSKRLRTPFFLALFSLMPATAFAVLAHLRLGLRALQDFNVWDVTRDTIEWYVGALGGIFILLLLQQVVTYKSDRFRIVVAPLALAILAAGVTARYAYFEQTLTSFPTTTSSGGNHNPDVARAMDAVWRQARNKPIYVSAGSVFDNSFYAFQMYGASSAKHIGESFEPSSKGEFLALANGRDTSRVIAYGLSRNGSVDVRGLSQDAYIVTVSLNGMSRLTSHDVPKVSFDTDDGAYGLESSPSYTFRWAKQSVTVLLTKIIGGSDMQCYRFGFANPWRDPDLAIELTSGAEHQFIHVASDATFTEPTTSHICAHFNEGQAAIVLTSNLTAKTFPKDNRALSFGLIWPPVGE